MRAAHRPQTQLVAAASARDESKGENRPWMPKSRMSSAQDDRIAVLCKQLHLPDLLGVDEEVGRQASAPRQGEQQLVLTSTFGGTPKMKRFRRQVSSLHDAEHFPEREHSALFLLRLLPDLGSLSPKMTCDVLAAVAKVRSLSLQSQSENS